jgi:hypothetical protein
VDQTPLTTDWKTAAGIAPSATAWIGPVSESVFEKGEIPIGSFA